MTTFGPIPSGSDATQLALSEDGKALTITFSDLGVSVDGEKPEPIVAKDFSIVLPVEGTDAAQIQFAFSGSAVVAEGASATLVYSINGQTAVHDFPPGDEDTLQKVATFFPDGSGEVRLFVLLLASRNTTGEAGAFLNVQALDAEILAPGGGSGT